MMLRGIFLPPPDPADAQRAVQRQEMLQMLRTYKKQPERRKEMLALAAEKEWRELFKEMLDYKKSTEANREEGYNIAIQRRDVALLRIAGRHGVLPLALLVQEKWHDGFAVALQRYDFHYSGGGLYGALIKGGADAALLRLTLEKGKNISPFKLLMASTANYHALLPAALEAVPATALSPNELAQVAAEMFERSLASPETIDAFIQAGMNVNYKDGLLLQAALEKGGVEFAQKMVEAGCEAQLYAEKVTKNLLANGAPRAAVEWLRGYNRALAPVAVAENNFVLVDHNSVAMTQALPQGGQLTMVFNFGLSQQILLARAGEQLAAPAAVSFSQIENRHLLREAAEAFARLGGDETLAEAAMAVGGASRLNPKGRANGQG